MFAETPRAQAKLTRGSPYGQAVQVACPKCARKTRSRLLETRQSGAGSIKRKRLCMECGSKFLTYERVEETRPMSLSEVKDYLRAARAKLTLALEKMP